MITSQQNRIANITLWWPRTWSSATITLPNFTGWYDSNFEFDSATNLIRSKFPWLRAQRFILPITVTYDQPVTVTGWGGPIPRNIEICCQLHSGSGFIIGPDTGWLVPELPFRAEKIGEYWCGRWVNSPIGPLWHQTVATNLE